MSESDDPVPSQPAEAPAPRAGFSVLALSAIAAAILIGGGALAFVLRPHPAPTPVQETPTANSAPIAAAVPAPPPGAKVVSTNQWIEWSEETDPLKAVYAVGTTLIQADTQVGREDRRAVLHITGPDGSSIDVIGEAGADKARVMFGVTRLDAAAQGDQVIVSSYTGGAHCCEDVKIAEQINGRWTVISLGQWDGGLGDDFPRDIDGDGLHDLQFGDNNFLYAFASYAGSWPPPVIKNLHAGQADDVSKLPRFKSVFAKYAAEAAGECAKHDNGACAGFMAAAARLGTIDKQWPVMLANYDPKDDWTLPTACRRPVKDKTCAKEDEVVFETYPEALRWFLGDLGYLPPVPLPSKGEKPAAPESPHAG